MFILFFVCFILPELAEIQLYLAGINSMYMNIQYHSTRAIPHKTMQTLAKDIYLIFI